MWGSPSPNKLRGLHVHVCNIILNVTFNTTLAQVHVHRIGSGGLMSWPVSVTHEHCFSITGRGGHLLKDL